jgi:hypothetical protein
MVAQREIIAYIDQTYRDQTIRIDGIQFIDCRFERCTLEFAGEALPLFQRCSLVDVGWNFVGPAGTTLAFLQMMQHTFGQGGKVFIESVIELIMSEYRLPDNLSSAEMIRSVNDNGPVPLQDRGRPTASTGDDPQ